MYTKGKFCSTMIATLAAYVQEAEDTEDHPFQDGRLDERVQDFIMYLKNVVEDGELQEMSVEGHGSLLGFLESRLDYFTDTDERAINVGEDFVDSLKLTVKACGGRI